MTTMEIMLFTIFFLIILVPLVLGFATPIYKKHHKATGGIINHDPAMRKFVYKIKHSGEDMIQLLKATNVHDELTCTVDFDRSVIRFSEFGSTVDYCFQIQKYNSFCILKLEQVALVGTKSAIPLKLNPFIVRKLQAEIVPFSQYGF